MSKLLIKDGKALVNEHGNLISLPNTTNGNIHLDYTNVLNLEPLLYENGYDYDTPVYELYIDDLQDGGVYEYTPSSDEHLEIIVDVYTTFDEPITKNFVLMSGYKPDDFWVQYNFYGVNAQMQFVIDTNFTEYSYEDILCSYDFSYNDVSNNLITFNLPMHFQLEIKNGVIYITPAKSFGRAF